MSHDATNWAIKQRGLKPAAKVVLWNLCDRYHPDNGCFPNQDTLARDCEMSRSTLNDHLAALEAAGLIRREQRRDSRTKRQKSTVYRFAFEPDFHEKPCPETGHGAVSENGAEPCPENGESRVRNPDANPVREPVKEPEREARESGREDSQPEDPKAVERAFWRVVKDWPGFAGMPKEPAKAAWFALEPEERAEAERKLPAWLKLLKAQRKSHVPAPSTYFREHLWADVPEPEEEKPAALEAKPFGPLWMVARMKQLVNGPAMKLPGLTHFQRHMVETGQADEAEIRREQQAKNGWPAVNRMHDMAERRQGVMVAPALEAFAELMAAVPVGSETYEQWREEHERRGWPWLPDPGGQPVVYFPRGGPAGIEAFEAALRGDDGHAVEAAE
ncbi:helix-turn-helix domain-containing protein [Nitratireductor sp. GCM10026969]|uniref:helix-turn-helix domain-containing protein n=1 Tax=Nitratireductor sp. GCM10026969 TaxID=3252645 RepID=UPI0036223A8E